MFRTRDFILVLTAVSFLVMAIGVTVFTQWQTTEVQKTQLQPAITQDGEYPVVTVNSQDFSRAEKLQEMRDKIAASGQLSITAPEPVDVIEEVLASTSPVEVEQFENRLQLCPGFGAANVNWSPIGVQLEEAEGARLVFRMSAESELVMSSSSSSSSSAVMPPQRDILTQLPMRNVPSGGTFCIPTDVIGIATDGSLIRNNEVALYGIFTSSTLVGYALDGFPIYGSSPQVGDICGGVMTSEGYRYQISPQRETILNCYSAAPIRL